MELLVWAADHLIIFGSLIHIRKKTELLNPLNYLTTVLFSDSVLRYRQKYTHGKAAALRYVLGWWKTSLSPVLSAKDQCLLFYTGKADRYQGTQFIWTLIFMEISLGALSLSFKGHCPWFWCGQGEKSVWFIKLASFISTWAGREVCVLDFKGPVVSYFDVGRLRSMLWKASSVTLPLPLSLSPPFCLSLSFCLMFSLGKIYSSVSEGEMMSTDSQPLSRIIL